MSVGADNAYRLAFSNAVCSRAHLSNWRMPNKLLPDGSPPERILPALGLAEVQLETFYVKTYAYQCGRAELLVSEGNRRLLSPTSILR